MENKQKKEYFTIALPSGRMSEESIDFLKNIGYIDIELPNTRELIFFDTKKNIRFLLVRNQDIPLAVVYGGAHVGICGRDLIYENNYDLTYPIGLPFGYCRLSLAIPESLSVEKFYSKFHIKVATKYPNITKEFFFNKGIHAEIIKLHGSIEIAPIVEMADCIVDLVSTGRTLKENNLKEIEVIFPSNAVLIVNRATYYLYNKNIINLIHLIHKYKKNIYSNF